MDIIKQGDFSKLAENYAKYRSGYSEIILEALLKYVNADKTGFRCVDIGAGTGIWTKMIYDKGIDVIAVEPNESMSKKGKKILGDIKWIEACGEDTGLKSNFFDWVTMASSFHWVETEKGLKEFFRILKPGGYFTALWNPRAYSDLNNEIEKMIKQIVPELKRKSSGTSEFTAKLFETLTKGGLFKDVIYMESDYKEIMSKERYIGLWESVNDVQSQAGPERFAIIIKNIKTMIKNIDKIEVPYKIKSWTATKNG